MATSGTITFAVTRNDIIRDALLEIGALDPGTDPDAQEIIDCARRLNIMVKAWNRQPYLYTTEEFQITLTPGTESYTIGAGGDINRKRPVRIVSARREDSAGVEVPIPVVSRQEYKDLPQKDTQAPANLLYYDPQVSLGVLYVWPTGTSDNVKLNLEAQRQIEDFSSSSDNPDVPKEAYLPLYLNLAVNVWRMFRPKEAVPADLLLAAREALEEWEEVEEENASLMIQPNIR